MKMSKLAALLSTVALFSSQAVFADITVGVSLSSTGPGASLGIPQKNVFALLPNKIGGEAVKYVVLDDATDPSVATKNARKLVSEDKADVLVGSSTTPAAIALSEVAFESKTPQLALSPISIAADRSHWVFRTPQNNSLMAGAIVEHMKASGVKSVGFIGFSDAYGEDWLTAVTPMLAKAGIKLAAVERYARNDTSVSGQVLKLLSSRPDAVLIVGSGSPAALPQTTLFERGFKGQIYQTHAAVNQSFLSVAGKAAEGVIMPVGPVVVNAQIDDSFPSKKVGADLVARYEEKYGAGSFVPFVGHAYDAWRLIEAAVPLALKKAKPGTPEFRAALRDALESNKDVVASHGVYNMSATDHFGLDRRARVLVRVEGGQYKLLGK
ncbi:ABC transporter substrate-binding protein [Rhodocyclus purpureus]|uniref:ABC transporter substrate-binding protein n=1 Tax=Rhodocyclus purpureus TaxID=1067 RepID=UPI00191483C5|nr:ABC transporter substrate-binding protein [Rhodocyclus purpureus]MBK5913102.1 branched-chain amino acid ABC transporter substrate-binding protein [Rhodocyclus purpureus]